MANKQAVVTTTQGTFVIDLRPDLAPNHVGYFIKLAREGAYNGTIFHRVIRLGIIQGGDPLSKDPAKAKLYGTGGLGVLKAEIGSEPATRGAVAAVLQPGKPDSGGAQFFVCVTDQPALDGQVHRLRPGRGRHGRRAEDFRDAGDGRGHADRADRDHLGRRFATRRRPSRSRSATETRGALAAVPAVLETSAGPITIEFVPDKAPEHVRNVPAAGAVAGVLDGTVVPPRRPGLRDPDRRARPRRGPLTEKQQKLVRTLQPEFNDTKHVKGILSMARGDDPASATTSFFIVTGDAQLARRQVHGVRPGGRRHGGGRRDRAGAGQGRGAGVRGSS